MILENFKETYEEESTIDIDLDSLALESVYENEFNYYVNDYIIFEATLRRDFIECLGILTEDGDKNFLQKIWEKVKEVLKGFIDKLKRLIESFQVAINAYKQDRMYALIQQYTEYFIKGKDKLKDFSIKNFHLNVDRVEGFDVFDGYNKIAMDINDIDSDSSEESIKAAIEKMDKIKMDEFKSKINETLYSKDNITNPFASDTDSVVNSLRYIINRKVSEISTVKTTKKQMQTLNKKLEKAAKKSIKDYKKDDKMEKDAKDKAIKQAQAYLTYINKCQKITVSITSLSLSTITKYSKEATRLYVAAGKYLKKELAKKESPANQEPTTDNNTESQNASYISNEYNEIVSEALVYDFI